MPIKKPKLAQRPSGSSMDYLRTIGSFTRSVSESRVGEKKPHKSPTPSPRSSPYSLAPSHRAHTPRPRTPHPQPQRLKPPLPNDTPLPSSLQALEAQLNTTTSQLQRLADRVESVNEWIEMDGIALVRLMGEIRSRVEKEEEERRRRIEEEKGGWRVSPGESAARLGGETYRGVAHNVNARPLVHFPPGLGDWNTRGAGGGSEEEKVRAHSGVRELKERIRAMRKWRRELERSVVWQREECWRVQRAMGVQREDGGVGEGLRERGEEGWGVGGKTWEKGCGRLPTQVEWECMFSEERLGWDDHGVRPVREEAVKSYVAELES